MVGPSKRLVAVLSLCVLLQQFSPAFAAHLSHKTSVSHKKKESKHHEKDYDEFEEDEDRPSESHKNSNHHRQHGKNYGDFKVEAEEGHLTAKTKKNNNKMQVAHDDDYEEEVNSHKRGGVANKVFGTILKKGWKLLGSESFINKVNFFTEATTALVSVTSIGLTISTAIGGCGTLAPSLTTHWNKFKELEKKFRDLSDQIDGINLIAHNRQIYINASFYEYQRTRDKLEEIANEKERIFNSFGPEVLALVKRTTSQIENEVKKKNATAEKMEEIQVYEGYTKGLDLGLNLLFPSLTLAFSGGKLLWKKYLKDTVIGKKLVGMKETMGNAISSGGSEKNRKFTQRFKKSKIMNTRFGKGLQTIGTKMKTGMTKVAGVFKSIGKRLAPFLGLANLVWSTFAQYENCANLAAEAEQSVQNITLLVEETKKILENVTASNALIQETFDNITGTAFDEAILGAMNVTKEMMLDSLFVNQTTDSEEIVQAIQNYMNEGSDLETETEKQKQDINEIQRVANGQLYRVPFTLRCYTAKGHLIQTFKWKCGNGTSSFNKLYQDLQTQDDTSQECSSKIPSLVLPTQDEIRAMWAMYTANNTINATCLMNNAELREQVVRLMIQGETDAATIARQFARSDETDEIQLVMDELRKDPTINFDVLPKDKQIEICVYKGRLNWPFSKAAAALNVDPNARQVTKEEYDAQECPVS